MSHQTGWVRSVLVVMNSFRLYFMLFLITSHPTLYSSAVMSHWLHRVAIPYLIINITAFILREGYGIPQVTLAWKNQWMEADRPQNQAVVKSDTAMEIFPFTCNMFMIGRSCVLSICYLGVHRVGEHGVFASLSKVHYLNWNHNENVEDISFSFPFLTENVLRWDYTNLNLIHLTVFTI